MNRIILFILTILMSSGIFADNSSDARKMLDKAASIVSRKGGTQASFVLSGNGTTQNGTIYIKGNKFYIDTKDAKMWYNGRTLWTYLIANDEVNVTTPTEQQKTVINPYSFITLYKRGYSLSYVKKGNTYHVRMVAQNKTGIKEMFVVLDSKFIPMQVRMNQNGKWTSVKISEFAAKNQPDGRFVFNPKYFPSAEVIDLRD